MFDNLSLKAIFYIASTIATPIIAITAFLTWFKGYWGNRQFEGISKEELRVALNEIQDNAKFKRPNPEGIPIHCDYESCRLNLELISKGWRSSFFDKNEFVDTHLDTYQTIYNLWDGDTREIADPVDNNRPLVRNYLTPKIHQAYREMRKHNESRS